MAHENVIEMREITKIFGEFVANDKINLELRKGEIHASQWRFRVPFEYSFLENYILFQ